MDKAFIQMKKIVSKDGSFITLHENGQLWISTDNGRSFSSCGTVIHEACNVHKASLDPKYDKYFPVNVKLMRFAKKFGIKQLRLISHDSVLVKYGWKMCQSYGYVSYSKFERLLRKRKQVDGHSKVVLLKRSDAVWRSE